MSTNPDIIGLAKAFLTSKIDLGDSGIHRSIADALLERDEKL